MIYKRGYVHQSNLRLLLQKDVKKPKPLTNCSTVNQGFS